MKNRKNMLLLLSSGGMMLSCFYTCTAFVFTALSHPPVPLAEAAMILVLATLITHIHHRRGWRRIVIFGMHAGGFLFIALWLCHRYYGIEAFLLHLGWVRKLFVLERGMAEWLVLISILSSVGILWFLGIKLRTQPTDRTVISHRYDMGLFCILTLLLIKLIIAVKGGVPLAHSSTKVIMAYIVIGLFSMGIVHTRSDAQSAAASYFKGIGIVISFTAITLMLGGGLVILFLPELQILAEGGADLLKTVKTPLEKILIAIAHISLTSGLRRNSGEETTGDLIPSVNQSGGELGIFHYLFIGIAATILLAMAGFIIYRLLKWLFSAIKWFFAETAVEKDKTRVWELLISGLLVVKRILSFLGTRLFHQPDASFTAEKFYRRLLRWGRFSGLYHAVSETPKEYGIRLGHHFPRIENEFRLIIHLHDETVYGCISPDGHQISRARLALRRIRNPFLWYARIKSLCFHDRV